MHKDLLHNRGLLQRALNSLWRHVLTCRAQTICCQYCWPPNTGCDGGKRMFQGNRLLCIQTFKNFCF